MLSLVLLARDYGDGSAMATETQKITDYLTTAWQNVGVKIDVQLVDADSFAQRIQGRDYDIVLAGQSLGDNLDTYSYWHSTQANSNGLNLSNYKSFAADQLIELIRESFVQTEKDKKMNDLAKVIAHDAPAIFLYRPLYSLASDAKVKGIYLQKLGYSSDRFSSIDQWCITKCDTVNSQVESDTQVPLQIETQVLSQPQTHSQSQTQIISQ